MFPLNQDKNKLDYLSCFLLPNLVGLKKFETLLPNLPASRDPTDACFDAAWQTIGGKGAEFFNHLNFSNKKTAGKLIFHRVCLQPETTKVNSVIFLHLFFMTLCVATSFT